MQITQEMIDAQHKSLHDGLGNISVGIDALKAENTKLREIIEEIDAELDRQLYDEEYVSGCRNAGLDIPADCEHHVVITQRLREQNSSRRQCGVRLKGKAA